MQQFAYIQEEVSRVYGSQHRPEPTRWMRMGGWRNAPCGSVVDLAEGSDNVVGSLGRCNPSTPRIGARARDNSRSPREKKDKDGDKMGDEGRMERSFRQARGKKKKQPGKGPKKNLSRKQPGKGPQCLGRRLPGYGPKDL